MNNERFEELRKNFLPRFWDTLMGVMLYPAYISQNNMIWYNETGENNGSGTSFIAMISDPRFIMMKPTGLLDTDETLIYEGDLVEDNYGTIYEVGWNDGGYWYILDYQSQTHEFIKHPSNCKICSNIHTDKGE